MLAHTFGMGLLLLMSKVGGIAAKTSLDQLFVGYTCTVMDEINGHYLQLP